MANEVEHVKFWVERKNREDRLGLTQREVDLAAKIGADTWKGNTGVGQAADNGISAVKRTRE
jgi:hypothetical protein